jgi:hypothetical protein
MTAPAPTGAPTERCRPDHAGASRSPVGAVLASGIGVSSFLLTRSEATGAGGAGPVRQNRTGSTPSHRRRGLPRIVSPIGGQAWGQVFPGHRGVACWPHALRRHVVRGGSARACGVCGRQVSGWRVQRRVDRRAALRAANLHGVGAGLHLWLAWLHRSAGPGGTGLVSPDVGSTPGVAGCRAEDGRRGRPSSITAVVTTGFDVRAAPTVRRPTEVGQTGRRPWRADGRPGTLHWAGPSRHRHERCRAVGPASSGRGAGQRGGDVGARVESGIRPECRTQPFVA